MRLPNRAERRAHNKKNKTNYSLQDFALIYAINGMQNGEDINWLKQYLPVDLIAHKDNWDLFPNGTKVKLNIENILQRPEKYLSEQFKTWIEDNKEEIFVINRENTEGQENEKGLVSLDFFDQNKNTELSKTWLFDMYSDLLVWSELEQTYVLPQKIEDLTNAIENTKQSMSLIEAIFNELSEEEKNNFVEIKNKVLLHDSGEQLITDPVIWQNMDNNLYDLLSHEVEDETLNTEGGEE